MTLLAFGRILQSLSRPRKRPGCWTVRVVTMAFFRYVDQEGGEEWFAVQVEPRLTQPILAALGQKGYDAFTPFQTVVRNWRDRTSKSMVPAFPGYIFARMDLRFRLPVLTTPGVRGLVGYGKQPASICEEEVEAIRRLMASKLSVEAFPFPASRRCGPICCGAAGGSDGHFDRPHETQSGSHPRDPDPASTGGGCGVGLGTATGESHRRGSGFQNRRPWARCACRWYAAQSPCDAPVPAMRPLRA